MLDVRCWMLVEIQFEEVTVFLNTKNRRTGLLTSNIQHLTSLQIANFSTNPGALGVHKG